jgi:hypothetical protein
VVSSRLMEAALLVIALTAISPFPDLVQSVDVVPKDLELIGKPVAAARWTDKLGSNILVITETARVGEASGGTKKLFGFHFVRDGRTWKRLWRTADAVTDCEFDLELSLVRESVSVTDLNGNGIAETAFAYTKTCTSDVSPSELKVLLHEGDHKCAVRGTTRVQVGVDDHGKKEFEGGERTPDPALKKAPRAFLSHALKIFDSARWK